MFVQSQNKEDNEYIEKLSKPLIQNESLMTDIDIKGRHKIFMKHLGVLSTQKDINQITNEWLIGEIRYEYSENSNDEILEYIKQKKLPPKELILRINGNIAILPNRCICGVFINEHCMIKNKHTEDQIWVGNCCVKHIDADEYEKINRSKNCLHRIINNGIDEINNKLNIDTIDKAFQSGILNDK